MEKPAGTRGAEIRLRPPVPPDPAEEEQVRLARGGDQEAFAFLVERYTPRVFRMAWRILGPDRETAADMTQEVFLRVFQGLGAFEGESRFSTWLHRIALNVCISERRRRKAAKRSGRTVALDAPVFRDGSGEGPSMDPADPRRGPAEVAADRDLAARLWEAVRELPEEMEAVVVLREQEGLGYEEIAEATGVPVGTVRSRLHRARLLLRQALGEGGP